MPPPKSIGEMTADSCVFLTGITGFVGGCLLERICSLEPGPARVFVLVRPKHGIDPQSRVEKLLRSPLFSAVPQHKLKLVQAVSGDVGSDSPDLGLSEADLRLLLDSCTHVFHSAAFISFAAELDIAIKINLRGSRAVLGLARRMKRIRSMVHVSTAYANCFAGSENSTFEERLTPVDVDPVDLIEAVESMSLKQLEARFAGPIGKHPNSYTFTKQLAECLLARERGQVPLSIVRPGIILNSWRAPFPGWVDNVNSAACGFIAGAGKGVFCTFQARSDIVMDAVPVDLVVSTILASALKAEHEPERVHVFHCTTGTVNPITWGEYCAGIIRASKDHPCENAAWYPRASLRESRLRTNLVIVLFQMIPAVFIDVLAKITKPGHEVCKVQWRYIKASNYTEYFSMREWQFSRRATDELLELLPAEEREKHPMDPREIDWDEYFDVCIIGTRRYFHGESETMKTSYTAERRMRVLRVIAILFPWGSFVVICCGLAIILGIPWTFAALAAALFVIGLVWL